MTIEHQEAQDRIQEIILNLMDTYGGNSSDREVIRDELDHRIKAAGLGEQPAKWLTDTADEIHAGRTVVTSTRSSVDIDQESGAVTTHEDRTTFDI